MANRLRELAGYAPWLALLLAVDGLAVLMLWLANAEALKAMALAFEDVNAKIHVDLLMVDGNRSPRKFMTSTPQIETVVKGDDKIHEIMAASILAKTARDRFMEDLDREYPVYGFCRNKGYPSKEHQEAIMKYGLSPCHRKSFHLKKTSTAGQETLPL